MPDNRPLTAHGLPQCPDNPRLGCSSGPSWRGLCCRITPVGIPIGFRVYQRNTHHWDVTGEGGRMFRIRGEPGAVLVGDERNNPALPDMRLRSWMTFETVALAMGWIAVQLMTEAADGGPDAG